MIMNILVLFVIVMHSISVVWHLYVLYNKFKDGYMTHEKILDHLATWFVIVPIIIVFSSVMLLVALIVNVFFLLYD